MMCIDAMVNMQIFIFYIVAVLPNVLSSNINKLEDNTSNWSRYSRQLKKVQQNMIVRERLSRGMFHLRREHEENSNNEEPQQSDVVEAIKYGLRSMKHLYEEKEPELYAMGLFLANDDPAHFVAVFNEQNAEYKQLSRAAYAMLEATKQFRKKFPSLSTRQALKNSIPMRCPRRSSPSCPAASRKYRTSDGSCNNLRELWWGSAMSTMQRLLPAVYNDGIESIRKSVTGAALPSARQVSDVIHRERDAPMVSITHMLMQWGQFVDHDVTATGQSRAFNGSVPQCCSRNGKGFQAPRLTHPDCLPIAVHSEDSQLGGEKGLRCLEFVRSGPAPAPNDDCAFGPREQLSQVTSFLDASTIYSSSAQQSDGLRLFRNGLMQYGKSRQAGLADICLQGSLSTGCFRAGDGRLSEQPALVSLHAVFLRLHNHLASDLSTINPHWSDERTFQESRKIVGALMQHVTYHEFLPIVLGQNVVKNFDLELVRTGYYNGYDPSANPNIANAFSSAAYRFGHSLVQRSFIRYDKTHCPLSGNVSIHEEFANPINLETAGSLERILLGLINQPAQKRDEFIAEELTNHLFQTPGFAFGMDLASLNIQRGRDHGIAPFVEWRRACALNLIRDWADLKRVMSAETADKFASIYAVVEDIDLFSAGLAEKPLRDGLVGPTFACIIAQQFRQLRRGDRFWYENPFPESAFSLAQLAELRKSTLAQILCTTLADGIDDIQPFVMLSVDKLKNQRLHCRDHPSMRFMNLEPWLERRAAVSTQVLSRRAQSPQRRRPDGKLPNKTRINQQNRVIVNRRPPLGTTPRENLTIVINNNAVYSPVYVQDSVYNSHQTLVDRFVSSSYTRQPPVSVNSSSALDADTMTDYYSTVLSDKDEPAEPYYPHNFKDQYNPDSPRYTSLPATALASAWLSQLSADLNSSADATQQRGDKPDKQKSSSEARVHQREIHTADNHDWDLDIPKPIDETTSNR
ncbi:chorion peroxidase-like [Phymastichus coffea]|uniref:chorion peroxidase-like n=1 Tax=Phymastichus coffea TaxID=108790 RepID=UPI00273CB6CA|nr:chorion peroxidase-like [Phymastichus coffea]